MTNKALIVTLGLLCAIVVTCTAESARRMEVVLSELETAGLAVSEAAGEGGDEKLSEALRLVANAAKAVGETASKAVEENRGITPEQGIGGLIAAALAVGVPLLRRNGASNERKARLEEQQRASEQRIHQLEQMLGNRVETRSLNIGVPAAHGSGIAPNTSAGE